MDKKEPWIEESHTDKSAQVEGTGSNGELEYKLIVGEVIFELEGIGNLRQKHQVVGVGNTAQANGHTHPMMHQRFGGEVFSHITNII